MKTVNERMRPLPSREEIVAWMVEADARDGRCRMRTAQEMARGMRVDAARRAGRGAIAGSWSGVMAPGLRLGPRLRAMVREGLICGFYEPDEFRWVFYVKGGGGS